MRMFATTLDDTPSVLLPGQSKRAICEYSSSTCEIPFSPNAENTWTILYAAEVPGRTALQAYNNIWKWNLAVCIKDIYYSLTYNVCQTHGEELLALCAHDIIADAIRHESYLLNRTFI